MTELVDELFGAVGELDGPGAQVHEAGLLHLVGFELREQRRKELAKVVSGEGEDTKIAIRNVRRDAMQHLKDLLKAKVITEDEDKRAEEDAQKLTDKFVKEVDAICKAKEDELMHL